MLPELQGAFFMQRKMSNNSVIYRIYKKQAVKMYILYIVFLYTALDNYHKNAV